MRYSSLIRVAVVFFVLLAALEFQFTLIWGDIFDSVGIVLAGLLVGPLLVLAISIEQWFSLRHKH